MEINKQYLENDYSENSFSEELSYQECISLIKQNSDNLAFIPIKHQTYELCSLAIMINSDSFYDIHLSKKSFEICKFFVSKSLSVKESIFKHIPYQFHNDEILYLIISKNHSLYQHIPLEALTVSIVNFYLSLDSDIELYQKTSLSISFLEDLFWTNPNESISKKITSHPNFPEYLTLSTKTFKKEHKYD